MVEITASIGYGRNFPRTFTYADILEEIHKAGSDDLSVFGGRFVGGYNCQQVPYEIANAIKYFHRSLEYENYLEIGSAAGGTTRLITDILPIKNVYVIDDNQHGKYHIRSDNFKHLKNSGKIEEWIGNSHSSECAETMVAWNAKFDLVFIDGDHSYSGVVQDTQLVLPHLNDGAFVMYHDTEVVPDVRKFWSEVMDGKYPNLKAVFNYIHGPNLAPRCGLGAVKYSVAPYVYKSKEMVGFWHIAVMNNWQEIVEEQLRKLEKSGLLDACDGINVCLLGDCDSAKHYFTHSKFKIAYESDNLLEYEFPAIRMLQDYCYFNDAKVFYFHTKGAGYQDQQQQTRISYWRRFMEHFMLEKWHDSSISLDEYDCIGTFISWLPNAHFPGNFWWANSHYIRRLYNVNLLNALDRVAAETWIGRPTRGHMKAIAAHQLPSGHNNLYVRLIRPEEYVDKSLEKSSQKILVVARYAESLDWLESISVDKIVIYNKGNHMEWKAKCPITVISQPNHGRESAAYLAFLNETSLNDEDIVIFTQGDPFPHTSAFINQVNNLNNLTTGYMPFTYWFDGQLDQHCVDVVRDLFRPFQVNGFWTGGIFAANGKSINHVPKFVFKELYHRLMESSNAVGYPYGYSCEVLWRLLFDVNDRIV